MRQGLIMFLILILIASAFTLPTKKCPIDKLYGTWIFVNAYDGKLTKIDTLKKEPIGYARLTYNKVGTYLDDQGDYTETGKFTLDKKHCSLKSVGDVRGDTVISKITYLDNQYMLLARTLSDGTFDTHFYKRK